MQVQRVQSDYVNQPASKGYIDSSVLKYLKTAETNASREIVQSTTSKRQIVDRQLLLTLKDHYDHLIKTLKNNFRELHESTALKITKTPAGSNRFILENDLLGEKISFSDKFLSQKVNVAGQSEINVTVPEIKNKKTLTSQDIEVFQSFNIELFREYSPEDINTMFLMQKFNNLKKLAGQTSLWDKIKFHIEFAKLVGYYRDCKTTLSLEEIKSGLEELLDIQTEARTGEIKKEKTITELKMLAKENNRIAKDILKD